MKYLRLYNDAEDFESDYEGVMYGEPWVSAVKTENHVAYDKEGVYDFKKMFFTIEVLTSGNIVWKRTASSSSYARYISYKKNNDNWKTIMSTTVGATFSVAAGDIVQFKGDNANYANNTFSGTTCQFNVKGNIMSLFNSENFVNLEDFTGERNLVYFFSFCGTLKNAYDLILPATGLTPSCYQSMFHACTSLVRGPELPATVLRDMCYYYMFYGCTSLLRTPELPATTLAPYCYSFMFSSCTSLSFASDLPATTLATNCYYQMFSNCTSLTRAPELPAPSLVNSCYSSMFNRCSSLNYILCLAVEKNGPNTENWVYGVSQTGLFIGSPDAKWSLGVNGVPEGWEARTELNPVSNHTVAMLIDDFNFDYEAEGYDTLEEFIEYYISDDYPGANRYEYTGEKLEYDGNEYYVWVMEGDNISDNVNFCLTETINTDELYEMSVVNNHNNRNCPIYSFLNGDLNETYSTDFSDDTYIVIDAFEIN